MGSRPSSDENCWLETHRSQGSWNQKVDGVQNFTLMPTNLRILHKPITHTTAPSLTLPLKPLSPNWHLGDGVRTFVHHLPGFLPSWVKQLFLFYLHLFLVYWPSSRQTLVQDQPCLLRKHSYVRLESGYKSLAICFRFYNIISISGWKAMYALKCYPANLLLIDHVKPLIDLYIKLLLSLVNHFIFAIINILLHLNWY